MTSAVLCAGCGLSGRAHEGWLKLPGDKAICPSCKAKALAAASENAKRIACAYCGQHGSADISTWLLIAEPDGPPRGLPAEWPCCRTCAEAGVPHQMRVRRRFDNVFLRLFTWGGWPGSALRKRLREIDDAAAEWLLDDLVKRGVLEREEWRPWPQPSRGTIVIYRDPRSLWRRIVWRWRLWRQERKTRRPT